MTRVNGHYLRALEAVAKAAADLEWMVDPDHGVPTCPWCGCGKRRGHEYCPFGRALARLEKVRKPQEGRKP